jgi:ferrous iron transport protein A
VGFTDDVLALKFLEMGLLPGSEVTVGHIAPFGDPIAIKMIDYLLAIRKDEAATVLVI